MSLFKFLKPLSGRLPTAEETSLPENAVRSANNAVQNMQRKEPAGGRKYTTTFTAEDRWQIRCRKRRSKRNVCVPICNM